MICLVEKQRFNVADESIIDGTLTMVWGEYRANKFGVYPAVVQLLVNRSTGLYNHSFSDPVVTKDTLFTVEGLPEIIQTITIDVI